jgi:glycosyltransferase involved in cell wall biosynthesis
MRDEKTFESPPEETSGDRRRGTVVLLIDGLGRGGAERLLGLYAPEIRQLGYNVRVVTLQVRDGNAEADKLLELGIPVHHIQLGKLRNLGELARLIGAVRRMHPSIVHTHLEASTVIGGLLRLLVGVPAITTLHTLEHPTGFDRASLRLRVVGWLLSNIYDRVICLSAAIAQDARNHGLASAPLVVLPNGIPPPVNSGSREGVRQQLRAELGIPLGAPVIVTVAVLRPPKGIDRLVAAMVEILKVVPSAHLLIVGDGSERARLERQVEEDGIERAVTFTGFRGDVSDVLISSDLFVLPTLWDALPTVVIEAMFASLPIVASRVGGLPDMITDNVEGVLVPPGDVDALANEVSKLLVDSQRRSEVGAAALKRARESYSLPVQARKLTDLYDQVIARERYEA